MIAFILFCVAGWLIYKHRVALLAWLSAPLPVTVVDAPPPIVIHLHQPVIEVERERHEYPTQH
jgi:hypothetical protein